MRVKEDTMGQRQYNRLSARFANTVKEKGRYPDGNGLYLVVDHASAKRCMLRTVVKGKRTDIGVGSLRLVSLSEARDRTTEYRKIARSSGDPLAERRRRNIVISTFEDAAKRVHKERSKGWRSEKHRKQWLTTVEQYAYPRLANRQLDSIASHDVLQVLSPIWLTKPETARRLAQRLSAIFDWGKAAGQTDGENPVPAALIGLPKQPDKGGHFAALPYDQVPGFFINLQSADIGLTTRLGFEFLLLTAGRTSEVLLARWDEIDLNEKCWAIPGERMKSGRPHRVPLSMRCIEIVKQAHKLSAGQDYVFPGRKLGKPMSNMSFLMALRRMTINCTVHGFRSSFRDWASECSSFSHEVCEAALAHIVKGKTEAAYRRGDLFEKRRKLMEAWSQYVTDGDSHIVNFPNQNIRLQIVGI